MEESLHNYPEAGPTGYSAFVGIVNDTLKQIPSAFHKISSGTTLPHYYHTPDKLREVQCSALHGSEIIPISEALSIPEYPNEFEDKIVCAEDVLYEHIETFGQQLCDFGWESIAWYNPFHFMPFENYWGIYVREDAFFSLVFECWRQIGRGRTPSEFYYLAELLWNSILAHEYFHYHVEMFAIQLEKSTLRAVYLPYSRSVYQKVWGTTECLEEAMATAKQVSSTETVIKKYLGQKSRASPPGYRDFEVCMPPNFVRSRDMLCGQVSEGSLSSETRPYRFPNNGGSASTLLVPIYLVAASPLAKGPRSICFYFTLNVNQLVKFVQLNGATIRQGGNHPLLIEIEGQRPIPLKKNWSDRRVPWFVVKELAHAFKMSPGHLVEEARKA